MSRRNWWSRSRTARPVTWPRVSSAGAAKDCAGTTDANAARAADSSTITSAGFMATWLRTAPFPRISLPDLPAAGAVAMPLSSRRLLQPDPLQDLVGQPEQLADALGRVIAHVAD